MLVREVRIVFAGEGEAKKADWSPGGSDHLEYLRSVFGALWLDAVQHFLEHLFQITGCIIQSSTKIRKPFSILETLEKQTKH